MIDKNRTEFVKRSTVSWVFGEGLNIWKRPALHSLTPTHAHPRSNSPTTLTCTHILSHSHFSSCPRVPDSIVQRYFRSLHLSFNARSANSLNWKLTWKCQELLGWGNIKKNCHFSKSEISRRKNLTVSLSRSSVISSHHHPWSNFGSFINRNELTSPATEDFSSLQIRNTPRAIRFFRSTFGYAPILDPEM